MEIEVSIVKLQQLSQVMFRKISYQAKETKFLKFQMSLHTIVKLNLQEVLHILGVK